MRRLLALLLLPLLLGLAPATATAWDFCPRADAGAPYTVRVGTAYRDHPAASLRAAVILCDRRTGRERRIVRTVWQPSGQGRWIGGASVHGATLAWTEGTARDGAAAVHLRVRDLRTGRTRSRRISSRRGDGQGVGVLRDGSLVWVARGVARRGAIDGPSHVVARAPFTGFAVEDGATLRWFAGGERRHVYVDLVPLPSRDGCPVRARFTRRLTTPDVVVSTAGYGRDPFIATGETRVCLRATGQDPALSSLGIGATRVVGSGGDWIAFTQETWSRYYGCEWTRVNAVNLRDRRAVRTTAGFPCSEGPADERPVVRIGPRGTTAWLAADGAVRALRSDGTIATLEPAAPPGTITGLTVAGDGFAWSAGGQARSATVP